MAGTSKQDEQSLLDVPSPRFDGEWFEDAESDPEWAEKMSVPENESIEESSVDERSTTLLDDICERNKFLEVGWREAEKRCQSLQMEKEKLKLQLENERLRAASFKKKLQYIQDNHEIFNRLKQAYLNMKYNESAGRDMIEIREIASQTWQGILCEECIRTAEVRAQMQLDSLCSFTMNEPETVSVKKDKIDAITETVSQLKVLIDKREKVISDHQDIEKSYKDKIECLEHQNKILQRVLACRKLHQEPTKQEKGTSQLEAAQRGCAVLKKIVFKQEKRIREMAKYNRYGKFSMTPLSDNEKALVEMIVKRYSKRLGKSSSSSIRSSSCDRDMGSELLRMPRILGKQSSCKLPGHGDSGDMQLMDSETYKFLFEDTDETKTDATNSLDLIDFSDNL